MEYKFFLLENQKRWAHILPPYNQKVEWGYETLGDAMLSTMISMLPSEEWSTDNNNNFKYDDHYCTVKYYIKLKK